MTDRELMQMALRFFDWFYSDDHSVGREDFKATQQALRERLAQPEYEFECPRCGHCCQQREWVGLTEDEQEEILNQPTVGLWEARIVRNTEAKLKDKNCG